MKVDKYVAMQNANNTFKCRRCGICCLGGPCGKGNEDSEHGICTHLSYDKKKSIFSCDLVSSGKVKPYEVGIRGHCILQKFPEIVEDYKKMYRELIEIYKR